MSDYNLETKCIHSGYTPSKGEPCALPVYQSTTYKYDTTDEMGQLFDLKADGYFYTRLQNPTNDAVAAKIADLEGGVAAILTSSGQAANFYAVFNICEAGDHVVAASTITEEPSTFLPSPSRSLALTAPLLIPMQQKKRLLPHLNRTQRFSLQKPSPIRLWSSWTSRNLHTLHTRTACLLLWITPLPHR